MAVVLCYNNCIEKPEKHWNSKKEKKPTDFARSKANQLGQMLQPRATSKLKRNFGERGTDEIADPRTGRCGWRTRSEAGVK